MWLSFPFPCEFFEELSEAKGRLARAVLQHVRCELAGELGVVRGQEALLEEVPLGRAVDVVLLGCRRVAWGGRTCGPAQQQPAPHPALKERRMETGARVTPYLPGSAAGPV